MSNEFYKFLIASSDFFLYNNSEVINYEEKNYSYFSCCVSSI